MNYRKYMRHHTEENLAWCRPYHSENGRVALSENEGRIQTLMIDGKEIDDDFAERNQSELWERVCRASIEDEELLDIETRRYSWREIALMDGLVECGCAECPWNDTCDAMSEEIEAPNELDDHPDSIFFPCSNSGIFGADGA